MRKSINQEQSPSFQFYASDWLTNPDRLRLSLEEQGADEDEGEDEGL